MRKYLIITDATQVDNDIYLKAIQKQNIPNSQIRYMNKRQVYWKMLWDYLCSLVWSRIEPTFLGFCHYFVCELHDMDKFHYHKYGIYSFPELEKPKTMYHHDYGYWWPRGKKWPRILCIIKAIYKTYKK